MAALSEEMFKKVLPLAQEWAEYYQLFIIEHGKKLSPQQESDARLVGVAYPDKIRLLEVPQIPRPLEGLLKYVNDLVQLITPDTTGLTLQYGIFIREDCRGSRGLLVHEFVHSSQYERLGSIAAFLTQYLFEVNTVGYPQAPMEQEAIRTAAKFCS